MTKKHLTIVYPVVKSFDKVESYEICMTCKGNGYFASAEELQVSEPLKLCQHCDGNGYLEPINTDHGPSTGFLVGLMTAIKELIRGKKYTRH
jgi:hypothetical protein